jgi:hypothetical protein
MKWESAKDDQVRKTCQNRFLEALDDQDLECICALGYVA